MANVVTQKYAIIGEFDYDNLIVGEQMPVIAKGITLAAGQGVLTRGTLLGIISGSGLAVMCDSTAQDGSQVPKYILGLQQGQLNDPTQTTIDTGAPGATLNVPSLAYQSGIFNRDAIITKTGQDIRTFETQLRQSNIILRSSVPDHTFVGEFVTSIDPSSNVAALVIDYNQPLAYTYEGILHPVSNGFDFMTTSNSGHKIFAITVNGTAYDEANGVTSAVYNAAAQSITITFKGNAAVQADAVTVQANQDTYSVDGEIITAAQSSIATRLANATTWA